MPTLKSSHALAYLLITSLIAFAFILGQAAGVRATPASANADIPPVLHFTMKSLGGKPVHLWHYVGKVIIIVNTASKCGFTPEYAPLEQLYKTYHSKGLVILGFPSNDFAHQEPGTDKQISQFCTEHYGVTFPMFSKVDVKGPHQCALYRFLTSPKTDPKFPGPVKWNFEKFLIARDGAIVARFRTPVWPTSPQVVAAVKAQLAK